MRQHLISIEYGELAVVADLHLRPDSGAEVDCFVAELAGLHHRHCLVVLGDLFDAWIGPGGFEEGHFPKLSHAISDFVAKGGRAILVRGNRDMLMSPSDGLPLRLELADGVLLGSAGSATLLVHGDQFCIHDRGYQLLRSILRCWPIRVFLRALPCSTRRWLAARMRANSTSSVARKPLDQLSLVDSAIEDECIAKGANKVVIGHLHQAQIRELGMGIELEVLPAWEPGAKLRYFKV